MNTFEKYNQLSPETLRSLGMDLMMGREMGKIEFDMDLASYLCYVSLRLAKSEEEMDFCFNVWCDYHDMDFTKGLEEKFPHVLAKYGISKTEVYEDYPVVNMVATQVSSWTIHSINTLKVGEFVEHVDLGTGRIEDLKKVGDQEMAVITFPIGERWITLSYSPLKKVDI
jgi:hypothetical protein